MRERKEEVLELVRREGPVLPVKVSKLLGTDILFASAVLSELVSEKRIFLTYRNVGGSPLYYVRGQEEKLQVLYGQLEKKEQEAYNLLKERKVLRDKVLEPSIRVALREIRDFAKMLRVNIDGNQEIFWKWYLVSNDVVEDKIKSVLSKGIKKEKREDVLLEGVKEDDFLVLVENYFEDKGIKVVSKDVVRKNREIDLVVEVPSKLGMLNYYVKARNKKNISIADLSLAFNVGQSKKMPVLFLSNGNISKKTKEYVEKNFKGFLVFKRL